MLSRTRFLAGVFALTASLLIAAPTHADSGVAAALHTHRIVAYVDASRIQRYLLVQLGDTEPKGVHGVQTVQVRYYNVSFTAGRADITDVELSARPTFRTVLLRGRIAHAQGASLQPGDTWSIAMSYNPAHPEQNLVTVSAAHAGHPVLFIPFGGGFVPYVSVT